jgi:phosphoribosylformylglycinamidine cyclo-ligase
MEVYVEENNAQKVIAIAKSFGVHADVIGYTEAHKGVEVKVQSAFGEFIYA